MLQIVYISTAREALSEVHLESILATSRINNRRDDVTGLLVAGGRRFLQALEGPADAVTATLERIRKDPRHFAVVELSRTEVTERAFGSWSMAYQEGSNVADGSGLTATVEKFISPIADKTLRAQFAGFAEIHKRAA